MSEVMDDAVMGMPYEISMGDELSRRQFYELVELRAENERLRNKIAEIVAAVNKQAEDDGVWFVARYATEAYLQQELRWLHEIVEK